MLLSGQRWQPLAPMLERRRFCLKRPVPRRILVECDAPRQTCRAWQLEDEWLARRWRGARASLIERQRRDRQDRHARRLSAGDAAGADRRVAGRQTDRCSAARTAAASRRRPYRRHQRRRCSPTSAAAGIVGHSERRHGHGEDDALVRAKAAAAHAAGPDRRCLRRRDRGRARGRRAPSRCSTAQIDGSLPASASAENLVVAYEPVWAIGTGLTPSVAGHRGARTPIFESGSARWSAAATTSGCSTAARSRPPMPARS